MEELRIRQNDYVTFEFDDSLMTGNAIGKARNNVIVITNGERLMTVPLHCIMYINYTQVKKFDKPLYTLVI